MAAMPSEIRMTIGFEESYQESLDFLEAMFQAGREKALQDGRNDLAEHYSFRLEVLDFQRKWVEKIATTEGTEVHGKTEMDLTTEGTEGTEKENMAVVDSLEGGARDCCCHCGSEIGVYGYCPTRFGRVPRVAEEVLNEGIN